MIRPIFGFLGMLFLFGVVFADSSTQLSSRWQVGQAQRVVVDFEVGGDLKLQENDKTEQVPMSVVAELTYDERLLPAQAESKRRALRHYEKAEAIIKINTGGAHPVLPEDRRRMLVDWNRGNIVLTCPDGLLGREILDLITVPSNSLVVDALLPGKTLQIGQSWKHDSETIQALIGLDSIAVCDVQSVLIGLEEENAKIQLRGTVEGASDGVATQIELKASYLFNTQTGRIAQMHLAIKEEHDAGPIGPGVSVVAKVRLAMEPIETPDTLSDQAVAALPESTESLLPLDYEHNPSGFRLAHDRAWHVTSEQRQRVILRHVVDGELTAQCNLVLLSKSPSGESISPDQFQKDVRFALGDRFGKFLSSEQWQSTSGMLCLCIVAEGKVDEVPILWRCYMVSSNDGQRLAVTCTVEQSLLERLDNADRVLIESLVLVPSDIPPDTSAAASEPVSRH
ncbi:MAG: hypothetical protein JW829_02550 [Pirellulales bacterium]|nr:hypothetical protein [Pirellulales bacterium]